jgi:hypothetical protein
MVMNDRRQATTRLVGRDAVVVKCRGRSTEASMAPTRAVGNNGDVGSSRPVASVDDGDVGLLVARARARRAVGNDGDVGSSRPVALV